MSADAFAAIRRKRDEYRTKWAALVEVLEDMGDDNPEGEPGDEGPGTMTEVEEEEDELPPPPSLKKVPWAKPVTNGAVLPLEANGTGEPRPRGAVMVERRAACARYLIQHGPTRSVALARAVGIPDGTITSVLKCELFRTDATGAYEVTQAGRDAAKGDD